MTPRAASYLVLHPGSLGKLPVVIFARRPPIQVHVKCVMPSTSDSWLALGPLQGISIKWDINGSYFKGKATSCFTV